jgi:hypothetical protein
MCAVFGAVALAVTVLGLPMLPFTSMSPSVTVSPALPVVSTTVVGEVDVAGAIGV